MLTEWSFLCSSARAHSACVFRAPLHSAKSRFALVTMASSSAEHEARARSGTDVASECIALRDVMVKLVSFNARNDRSMLTNRNWSRVNARGPPGS